MEVMIMVTVLCITVFSLMVTPCTSLQLHERELPISVSTQTRKLKILEETKVKGYEDQDSTSNIPQPTPYTSSKTKKTMMHEWTEDRTNDTSEYFTMDYSPVRRRHPIHNKSIAVGP